MRVAFGCDHRGFPYKADLVRALQGDGHTVIDFGTSSTEPVDYPDYARLVGEAVRDGRAEAGVLVCGSGAGVSIAANKIRGVRAALCHDLFTARQSREDDDANVLCLGSGVVSVAQAIELARAFLTARFSGAERHVRRLAKVLALEAGAVTIAGTPWPSGPAIAAAHDKLERLGAAARIWARDAGLWSEDPAVRAAIVNRLGWLDSPTAMGAHLDDLAAFAAGAAADGITDVVLLGMGGSSLAAEVLAATFPPPPGAARLTVLDTTDPSAVRAVREHVKPRQSLFLVSSKSGTTTETLALYRFFRAELERNVERAGAHFAAITDAGTPLERLAREAGFRRTFLNPPDIGGRFSALSLFGLVPAALLGVDTRTLLDRARAMAMQCRAAASAADNPGLHLAAVLGGLGSSGRDKVTLVLSEPIRSLGAWLEQLLMESTGKQGCGLVVVHDEPLGPPAVYGSDRVFVSIALGRDVQTETALAALESAGHPVVRLALTDRFDVGAEFFRWEMATAAVGALLGINPFDEPNVAQAKEATQSALAVFTERGRLPDWPDDTIESVAAALTNARPGDYVAWLAYLTPEPATTAALAGLRRLVRDRLRLASTVGYGPRYLHSTGQLHKGGPPTPILIVLTPDDGDDLPIPGERHGFRTLLLAQALGDLATLQTMQRRVFRLPVRGAAPEALGHLAAALAARLPR